MSTNIETIVHQTLNEYVLPELAVTLKDLGIVAHVARDTHTLTIELHAGFPCASLESTLVTSLTMQLEKTLNINVHVSLHQMIRAHRTQIIGKGLRGIKNTIAVASGKGGVGKSTVTINLAAALMKQGARVGILDADIYGPSIPLMLGKTSGVDIVDEHYMPVQVHGLQAMSIGYLTDPDSALIWRGPMLAKALIQMLDITQWDDLDYLLIDLPPGTGDIQLSLTQKIPLTAAIIVTTPQNVATLDAQKALKMFETTNIHVLGILENMSLHVCSHCGHEETLFGQGGASALAEHHHTQLLGQLPLHASIGADCERGLPTVLSSNNALASPFLQASLKLSTTLAKRPLNYTGVFPPVNAG